MIEFRIGDVFKRLAEIPDGSVDLVVTSPPFLALRSYLPVDHPDKGREIGQETTPAAFIDTLLALSVEWGRVLAPHGSLCVELGDTFSGSGGGGGDYLPGGLREGQQVFAGSGANRQELHDIECDMDDDCSCGETERLASLKDSMKASNAAHWRMKNANRDAWPLAKSLTGIPTLYPWSLAYGRNLLTGAESPAGQWRIRNVIVWARPNPPVGALGDKFRPATSYITVACKGAKRYFDLDAVRTTYDGAPPIRPQNPALSASPTKGNTMVEGKMMHSNPAGAPPLDWHADEHPEDGDWLWKLSTQPYRGSHYATYPLTLPKRLIEAMCPLRVCRECGTPSERVTGDEWTDCGHDDWRTGVVLDPFAGSGTTLAAAQGVGRHAIGIDLDERNAELARQRVGMFMEVRGAA